MEAPSPRAKCPGPGLAVSACVEVRCGMEGVVSFHIVGKSVDCDRVERWLRAMEGAGRSSSLFLSASDDSEVHACIHTSPCQSR